MQGLKITQDERDGFERYKNLFCLTCKETLERLLAQSTVSITDGTPLCEECLTKFLIALQFDMERGGE